jgi:hypothetical protein
MNYHTSIPNHFRKETMDALTLPTTKPDNKLQLGSVKTNAELWLYDTLPDAQPWLETAAQQAQGNGRGAVSFLDFSCYAQGAPLGPHDEDSLRVARVVGVASSPSPEGDQLKAVWISHGCVYATWKNSAEGSILQMHIQEPSVLSWGTPRDELAETFTTMRAMRQYMLMLPSLIAEVEDLDEAIGIEVLFEGLWDDASYSVKKKELQDACNDAWDTCRQLELTMELAA